MLIGAQEADQAFRLQPTVCVGDQSPGESEYARISLERSIDEFWNLTVKSRRKIGADCKYLFGENMEIVDEPLGGGCCGSCVSGRFDGRQIGEAQRFVVVSKARFEATVDDRAQGDALGSRQTCGVLLKPLDTEQFFTYGRVASLGARTLEAPKKAID